jgi:ABC-type transporter Mla subunit MlaD
MDMRLTALREEKVLETTMQKEIENLGRMTVGQLRKKYLEVFGEPCTLWFQQIRDIRALVDRRLGDTLTRVDTALGTVDALRLDVKPAINGAAAVEADAKDSWDDLYWEVKAFVGSATVTARGVAETSEAIGKAAPALAESAAAIGASADGIAADVHQATTDFVKPRTLGQKFRSWLETAGKLAARFL